MNLTDLIINRMMEKRAHGHLTKIGNNPTNRLKNLPRHMPKEYYMDRHSASSSSSSGAEFLEHARHKVDPIGERGDFTDMWDWLYADGKPDYNKLDVNTVRLRSARDFIRGMRLQPGSDKYNQALKFLLNHGQVNQYNYLNPAEPIPNPKVDKNIFNEKEQKQLQYGGPSIAYNASKTSSNVV